MARIFSVSSMNPLNPFSGSSRSESQIATDDADGTDFFCVVHESVKSVFRILKV